MHSLRARAIFGVAVFAAFLIGIPRARAGVFYYELAVGGSHWFDSGALYNGGNPTGYDFAGNADVFVTLGGNSGPIQFQGGLLSRYTTGSDATSGYRLVTLYPELRMQMGFIFVGAGITPFVLPQGGPDGSGAFAFGGFASRYAYDGEAGLLWSVVPIFSLGLAASTEWVHSSASVAGPVVTGTFLMRFYFGFFGGSDSGGSSHASAESKGWRYPFGDWLGN